ncbi:MAG TPA: glycosyltransferase family 2 protein [Candidatus Eisenbacteria bacterium]|nr:glycosyltransferase family 2 protein [Candidatus Eisenbacteria bacterium]
MKNPLVTISIPTYNSEAFLPKCLQAIKDQSYKHVEINIIDGGSSDKTIAVAQKFGVKNILVSKGSLMRARFEGAKKSHGTFVLILDSDQILGKETIKKCINEIAQKKDMVALGEDVYSKKTLLEKLFYLDRQLVDKANDLDPYTSVILPRFFKKSLILKAYQRVPSRSIDKASLQDHAILYLEAWKISKRVGYIKNAVKHMEPGTWSELWRKFYRWGYLSVNVDSTGYDEFFRKRTMRFRRGLFRKDLIKQSIGSMVLLSLKEIPFASGIISGKINRFLRKHK